MKDVILIGRGEMILEVPAEEWRKHLAGCTTPLVNEAKLHDG